MDRIGTKTTIGLLSASVLLAAASTGALAAGHSETVVAFDPEASEFSEGVAVDAEGNIYVSLAELGQLVRVAPGADSAEIVGVIEGIGEGDSGLGGLTIGPDDAVYAALNSRNHEINGVWRFDAVTGDAEHVAGTEVLAFPSEPAFADDGTLYVTDMVSAAIWRVPKGGTAEPWVVDPLLDGTGELGFGARLGPNGIEVVGDTVYVGTTETAYIVTIPINADGTAGTLKTFVQHDSPIDGLDVDAAGNVYTTHPWVNEVRRTDANGDIEVVANIDDRLDGPTNVAIGIGPEGETAYIANLTSVPLGGNPAAGPSVVRFPTSAEGIVSGASGTDGAAFKRVAGLVTAEPQVNTGSVSIDGDIVYTDGLVVRVPVDFDDDRLDGEMMMTVNQMEGGVDGENARFSWITYRIQNESGAWAGEGVWVSSETLEHPRGRVNQDAFTLHGEGDYEGMTVVLFTNFLEGGPSKPHGLLIEAETPAMPEPVEPF